MLNKFPPFGAGVARGLGLDFFIGGVYMKNKLAARLASLALSVVFTLTLIGAPKAKAVAVEAAA